MPKVGFLVVKDPSELLEKENHTVRNHWMEPDEACLPRVVQKYAVEVFNNF